MLPLSSNRWERQPMPMTRDNGDPERVQALEQALRNIAEGDLGDLPWQANYTRIRQVAAAALANASPDPSLTLTEITRISKEEV